MTNSVISDIEQILKDTGRVVNLRPQEKQLLGTREIILMIDGIQPRPESPVSYFVDVRGYLMWGEKDSLSIVDNSIELIKLIEEGLTTKPKGFRFNDIEINNLGTQLVATLIFTYKEVIQIGT